MKIIIDAYTNCIETDPLNPTVERLLQQAVHTILDAARVAGVDRVEIYVINNDGGFDEAA